MLKSIFPSLRKKRIQIFGLVCFGILIAFATNGKGDDNALRHEHLLLNFRISLSMWSNLNRPIEYRQTNGDNFEKINEIKYITAKFGDSTSTELMMKSLHISNAPYIGRIYGGDVYMLTATNETTKLGSVRNVTADFPNIGSRTKLVERFAHVSPHSITSIEGQIFEYHTSNKINLIGNLKYKNVIIDGKSVSILLTQSLKNKGKWFGEHGSSLFEVNNENIARRIGTVSYKQIRCGQQESIPILMMKSKYTNNRWTGYCNKKLIKI